MVIAAIVINSYRFCQAQDSFNETCQVGSESRLVGVQGLDLGLELPVLVRQQCFLLYH